MLLHPPTEIRKQRRRLWKGWCRPRDNADLLEISKEQPSAAAVAPGAVTSGAAPEASAPARCKMSFEPLEFAGALLGQGLPTTPYPHAEMCGSSHEHPGCSRVIPGLHQLSNEAV